MILKQNDTHSISCSHDIMKNTLRKFHKEVVDRARNTQETMDVVLSQCISKLPDPARIRFNFYNTKMNFLCSAHFAVRMFHGEQLSWTVGAHTMRFVDFFFCSLKVGNTEKAAKHVHSYLGRRIQLRMLSGKYCPK